MRHIIYCVMCLGREVQMYHMNSTMKRTYNELISVSQKSNPKQMYACYECAYLLKKYDEFKRKCCKAYNILCILGYEANEVSEKSLSSIDRKQNGLVTKLTSHTFTYDYETKKQACGSYQELNNDNVKYNDIPSEKKMIYIDDDTLDMEQLQSDIKSAPQDDYEEDYTHLDFTSGPENDIEIDQVPSDFKSTPEHDIEIDQVLSDFKSTPEHDIEIYQVLSDFKSTPEHDIENDYQFTHTYQVESTKSDTGSMLWLTIQSKENSDIKPKKYKTIKPHLNTPTQLHQDCFDTVNDYNILDKNLVIDGTKAGKEAVKIEIKSDTTKASKTSKLLETVNDVSYKQMTNKVSQNKYNKRSDGSHIEDSNCLKTLESNLLTEQVTVTQLTPKEARREFRQRMNTNNYVNSRYKCDLCYRGFLNKMSHETHMRKHSLKYGAFQCNICKLQYPTASYRNQHLFRVHSRKFSCNICPYICFNLNQCNAHIQSHKGKKFKCKKCDMSFGYRNSLLTHAHLKHSLVECACELCGSTFASARGLLSHKHFIHRGEKNDHQGPKCDECDVHFASELAWKRHRVLSSRHEVKYGCKVCGDVFQDQHDLKKHSQEHVTREWIRKPFYPKTCFVCKATLSHKTALKNHILAKHPTHATKKLKESLTRDYVCEFCGKTFLNRFFLASHQKKHSDETPYSCPECGMKTKYKSILKSHLKRMHTNEVADTFLCDLCGKSFVDKSGLTKHMKGHMGIRPFKCVACDKTFLFRSDERTHYKHVHENVPYPKKNVDPKKRRRKNGPYARIQIFDHL